MPNPIPTPTPKATPKPLVSPKAYLGLPQDDSDADLLKLAGDEETAFGKDTDQDELSMQEPFGGIKIETRGKYYTEYTYVKDLYGQFQKVYLDLDEAGEPVWHMKPQEGTSKTYTVQKGDAKYEVTEQWEPDEFGNMDVPTISIRQTVFAKEKELGEPPPGISPDLWYNENLTDDDRNKLTTQSSRYMYDATQKPPYDPGPNASWQWNGRNWAATVNEQTKRNQRVRSKQYADGSEEEWTEEQQPDGTWTEVKGSRGIASEAPAETPAQKSQREAAETNQRLQAQERGQQAFYEREAWANNPRNPQVYNAYLSKNPLSPEYSPTAQAPTATLRGLIEAMGFNQPFYNVAEGTTGQRRRVTAGDEFNLIGSSGLKPNMPPDLASFLSTLPFNQQGLASLRPDQIAALEAAGSGFGLDWQTKDPETGAARSTGGLQKFITDVNIPFWEEAQKEQEYERWKRDPNAQAAFRSDMEKRALPFWEEQRRRTSATQQGGLAGSGRYR